MKFSSSSWGASIFLGAMLLGGCATNSSVSAPASPPSQLGPPLLTASGDSGPVPRFRMDPVYPFEARKLGMQGEVLVDFIVDSAGNVVNAHAIRSTHPIFEPAAVAAVSQWKFLPGMKAGRPVNTHMRVPITFFLGPEKPAKKN